MLCVLGGGGVRISMFNREEEGQEKPKGRTALNPPHIYTHRHIYTLSPPPTVLISVVRRERERISRRVDEGLPIVTAEMGEENEGNQPG